MLRAELAARYEAGATIRELAAWSGAHRQTVLRHLVQAGVELRRLGLTVEQSELIERLYLEGRTLVEIAAEFDVAASTIRSCLLRRGVTMRPAARRRVRSVVGAGEQAQGVGAVWDGGVHDEPLPVGVG